MHIQAGKQGVVYLWLNHVSKHHPCPTGLMYTYVRKHLCQACWNQGTPLLGASPAKRQLPCLNRLIPSNWHQQRWEPQIFSSQAELWAILKEPISWQLSNGQINETCSTTAEWTPPRKCFIIQMQSGYISVHLCVCIYIYTHIHKYILGLSWVLISIKYWVWPTGTVFVLVIATLQLGLCYLFWRLSTATGIPSGNQTWAAKSPI